MAWTKATTAQGEATASTAGVLRPDEFGRHVELVRYPAGPAVARWVENHWALRWDLPEGRSFVSQVIPHPTCSLTVEIATHPRPRTPDGETVLVTGVCTDRFDVEARGSALVVGVRFRPGGLAALAGRSAAAWTDRTVSAREVLPAALCRELADADLAAAPTEWIERAESGLAHLDPPADPRYDELLEIVGAMLHDRSLVTVADVAVRVALSTRTLQRLFKRYVGVGPKWVLERYRMHDVVAAIDDGYEGTMTELAQRHGWYDQSHLTRDFTALVGQPPREYRDRRS